MEGSRPTLWSLAALIVLGACAGDAPTPTSPVSALRLNGVQRSNVTGTLGLGGQLFSSGGSVSLSFLEGSAGFTSDLYLTAPASTYIGTGHVTTPGTTVTAGPFSAGQELTFSIYVRNTGDTFYSGPASRNPDGKVHATVAATEGGCMTVWFEDLFGGGDESYDEIGVEVCDAATPNRAPVAAAGADTTVECVALKAIGIVDGSGSSDPDGDPLTYTWRDNAGNLIATTPTTSVTCNPGWSQELLILTVEDGKGGSAIDSVVVYGADTQPPVISNVVATPNVLPQPNKKMVPVVVQVAAQDACYNSYTCQITSVSSNEPGEDVGDWVITGRETLELRAERVGNGSGRVYSIVITCTDGFGNASSKVVTVTVPKGNSVK